MSGTKYDTLTVAVLKTDITTFSNVFYKMAKLGNGYIYWNAKDSNLYYAEGSNEIALTLSS